MNIKSNLYSKKINKIESFFFEINETIDRQPLRQYTI